MSTFYLAESTMTNENALRIMYEEKLPKDTLLYQVEDGTIFYRKTTHPERLYVKWDEQEIDAKLPGQTNYFVGAIGNAIFFVSSRKMFKAVFTPKGRQFPLISVTCERNVTDDESMPGVKTTRCGICSKMTDGHAYVYEMLEDPDTDGVLIDGLEEKLRGFKLRRIHRGKAIYVNHTNILEPLAEPLGENVIVVHVPDSDRSLNSYVPFKKDSPFVYFAYDRNLYALDIETLEFLLPLQIIDYHEIGPIAGIRDGVITVRGKRFDEHYLIKAILPLEYYEKRIIDGNVDLAMLARRIKELETKLTQMEKEKEYMIRSSGEKVKEMEKRQNALFETIDERDERITAMEFLLEQAEIELEGARASLNVHEVEKSESRTNRDDEIRTLSKQILEVTECNQQLKLENEELRLSSDRVERLDVQCRYQKDRIEQLVTHNAQIRDYIRQVKFEALQMAKLTLKFHEVEKLSRPLVCNQLENGTIVYVGIEKAYEIFIRAKGNDENVDLKLQDGDVDISCRGVFGNSLFLSTVSRQVVRFHKLTVESGQIICELINEMEPYDISLVNSQPYYIVENAREWSVFQCHQKLTEQEGDKFDITEVDNLRDYEQQYHRGVLYLFREDPTACVENVNEKVVRVEGPLLELDEISFYTPLHSDFIYILHPGLNILLILNTTNLSVTQICYEPPENTKNQSIVGIHNGILTMYFDGPSGCQLMAAQLP